MSLPPRMPEELNNTDALELYKEFGEYERHFNRIQSVYRGLASTWFLASFVGIGSLYSKDFSGDFPITKELSAMLAALAGGTGISLLWFLDVKIYHRLLVSVLSISEKLESTAKNLPGLREQFKATAERLNVRTAISIFYAFPTAILSVVSLGFLLQSFGVRFEFLLPVGGGIWLVLLVVL